MKAEYQPSTIVAQHDCEALALILAERKICRPGTLEFQRLNEGSVTLRASLESSRLARVSPPASTVNIEEDPRAALERLDHLRSILVEIVADEADGKKQLAELAAKPALPPDNASGTSINVPDPENGSPVAPIAPPPFECHFCQGACVGRTDQWFASLHSNDPLEIAREQSQHAERVRRGWEVPGGTRRDGFSAPPPAVTPIDAYCSFCQGRCLGPLNPHFDRLHASDPDRRAVEVLRQKLKGLLPPWS